MKLSVIENWAALASALVLSSQPSLALAAAGEEPAPSQAPQEAKGKTAPESAETPKPKPKAKPNPDPAAEKEGAGSKGSEKPETAEKEGAGKDKDGKAGEQQPAEAKVHVVKRGEFELSVEIDGVLEAVEETPVSVDPAEWKDLTLALVAGHGDFVKQGEVLARFETKELAEQIAELEKGLPLAELNLKLARQELDVLEKTTPISLENARRSKMEGEQDLAYFEDVERELRERGAAEDVKRAQRSLAYAQEELQQLEKMYLADDLTEETEEIILQRARNDVAFYEWTLEQTEERSSRALTTGIPREHQQRQRGVRDLDLAWRQAEQGLPENLRKKRLEVEAQELALEKSGKKLAGLKTDLASLTVTAPRDGIVYYGASNRGKWVGAATVERRLVPGGKIQPREVFLTLVHLDSLQIRAAVPEAKLRHLAPGLAGLAWPAWNDDAEFKTRLKSLSLVPHPDNTSDAVFTVPQDALEAPLFPGMNAKVRLDLYSAEDALTVPRQAVRKDAKGRHVLLKDGSRRPVKTGKASEQAYEILDGLKEGDEVKLP